MIFSVLLDTLSFAFCLAMWFLIICSVFVLVFDFIRYLVFCFSNKRFVRFSDFWYSE